MKLDIQGHSGCDIVIVHEDNDLFIHKSTHDPGYVPRLVNQANKQIAASKIEYQNIRVPKVFDVEKSDSCVVTYMGEEFEYLVELDEELSSENHAAVKSAHHGTIGRM